MCCVTLATADSEQVKIFEAVLKLSAPTDLKTSRAATLWSAGGTALHQLKDSTRFLWAPFLWCKNSFKKRLITTQCEEEETNLISIS